MPKQCQVNGGSKKKMLGILNTSNIFHQRGLEEIKFHIQTVHAYSTTPVEAKTKGQLNCKVMRCKSSASRTEHWTKTGHTSLEYTQSDLRLHQDPLVDSQKVKKKLVMSELSESISKFYWDLLEHSIKEVFKVEESHHCSSSLSAFEICVPQGQGMGDYNKIYCLMKVISRELIGTESPVLPHEVE